MFYDKFIELCKLNNEKPTPLLNQLKLSSGNLKRWANGSNVSFETIKVLAEHFKVTIDYFFDEDDEQTVSFVNEGNSLKGLYEILKAHPDYIVSFVNGNEISCSEYKQIAQYMKTEIEYLASPDLYQELEQIPKEMFKERSSNIPIRDFILNILGKIPKNAEYKYLQVQISTIILQNLLRKNITEEKLLSLNLVAKKIKNLNNASMSSSKKNGLNLSDLIRISEAFDVSFDYMLTGE